MFDYSRKPVKWQVGNFSYLTRKDDHILAIPTKEQRNHAVTGYDLLSNLMVPGVSVDRLKVLEWNILMCRLVNMQKMHML